MMNEETTGDAIASYPPSIIQNSSLGVALYEPEIPPNAGAVARLCAATGAPLHMIGRLGFSFSHPAARRAAMDYWEQVTLHRHVNFDDFLVALPGQRVWMLSTHGTRSHWDAEFAAGDVLLFGPESRGLPAEMLARDPERVLRIPMRPDVRSLNLATSVAITLYEALRQLRWRPDGAPPASQSTA
jgi:tRNA (cytidine/uridine-2'-O-)-methyltransferase